MKCYRRLHRGTTYKIYVGPTVEDYSVVSRQSSVVSRQSLPTTTPRTDVIPRLAVGRFCPSTQKY
jgi:hypothetical protein